MIENQSYFLGSVLGLKGEVTGSFIKFFCGISVLSIAFGIIDSQLKYWNIYISFQSEKIYEDLIIVCKKFSLWFFIFKFFYVIFGFRLLLMLRGCY